jgi:hypothetical protein
MLEKEGMVGGRRRRGRGKLYQPGRRESKSRTAHRSHDSLTHANTLSLQSVVETHLLLLRRPLRQLQGLGEPTLIGM